MSEKLSAPQNVVAVPRDSAILTKWNEVEGADGYTLHFYKADEPERCIKRRYAQTCSKQILGMKNGVEYLVSVRAFYYEDGKERMGEMSEKVPFVPMSPVLKAQKVICLSVGEMAQINWECRNTRPMAYFSSDNEAVAVVGAGGLVRAVSEGNANITVSADNQKWVTKIVVGRELYSAHTNPVLMFTGDIMCAASQQRKGAVRSFDFHDSFNSVRDILKGADYTVGVLETTCCDSAPYEHEKLRLESGAPNCNSPSTLISAVAGAGYDMLVTSNNHCCDTGYKGLSETVECIKEHALTNLGTLGDNPVVKDIKGIRVGFIAVTMISNNQEKNSPEFADRDVIGWYTREHFDSLIEKARKDGAEFIVAYQHWGTMNSRTVTDRQIEEAKFMAENGADIIIGSHPHVIQEFRYVKTADGRRVPCAFSLGNFLTSQAELDGNRDGVILRVELVKKEDGIAPRVSYIPTISADASYGIAVRPVYPAFSEMSCDCFDRIKESLGSSINHFIYRPLIALSGSVLLDRIFSSNKHFRTDKTPMLLSQLTACAGKGGNFNGADGALKLDIEKSFPHYVKNCTADYLAVDFYTAAAISCYRLGNTMYTGTKRFLNSDFYQAMKDDLERIKPPFDEALWKPAVEKYANAVLSGFSGDRVILFRHKFPDKRVKDTELRNGKLRRKMNKQIAEMEEYFIGLVDPAVVNVSGCYFASGSLASDFESEYYLDACNAAEEIITKGRRCVTEPDLDMWYDRLLRYYDNMTSRAYQRWMLNMRCASDMIIAYTNKQFAAINRDRLLKLKHCGVSQLSKVATFFTGDIGAADIVAAAEVIEAVLSGDTSRPYEVYAPAFKNKYNILKLMAKLLTVEVKAPVTSDTAEVVYLLRERPDHLRQYLAELSEVTVDIWGSCISKEILNRCKAAGVGKYIFKQCPLLSYEAMIPIEVPEDDKQFSGNNWRRRTIADAFARNGLFTLCNSSSKWLVMDFYDAICEMNEIDGHLFEIDEFISKTDFYNSIKSKCKPCYLFEKRSMKHCRDALSRFTLDLKERYGKNIILIRADLKDTFVNMDDRLEQMTADPMLDFKRKFIALCEEMFIQFTGCYVIDISRHFYSSDRFPLGGAHIVHYEEEFYRQSAEYLSQILAGNQNRLYNMADQDYLRLRDLRLARK